MRLFASGLLLTLSIVSTAGAQTHPNSFDRTSLAVPTASPKSTQRNGLVTRHSIAVAACRTAAARYGKLVGNDLRLLDRHTFLISGQIVPAKGSAAREVPDPVRKAQQFDCKVTDTGQVLEHTFGSPPSRNMTARPRS